MSQDIPEKLKMKKILISFLMAMLAGVLFSCAEEPAPDPVPDDKWLLISPSYASIYVGDEYVVSPKFSSEEAESLDYEWSVSDPEILSITEDNNTSVTVSGLKPGTATVKVECPGETKRLSGTFSLTVQEVPPAEPEPLRILAIGNSFSQDAVEQYLWNLFDEAGEEVIIGNMYIGGCSLERHWGNAQNNTADYEYRKVVNGSKTNTKGYTLERALADENWDYISVQQASDYSGMYDEYEPYLTDLVGYVRSKATNKNVKILFHQTWAYSKDSNHQSFPNYDKDQMKMYNGIVDAAKKVMEKGNVDILIPSGTAIQNGRTSYIGDEFDRDGYHLNEQYGRFTAACTWYQSLIGYENITVSALDNTFVPASVDDSQASVARNAAVYAVQKPYEVTDMSSFTAPSEE